MNNDKPNREDKTPPPKPAKEAKPRAPSPKPPPPLIYDKAWEYKKVEKKRNFNEPADKRVNINNNL